MLAMVPDGPVMLLAFNFKQFAGLDLFDKMVKKDWQNNAKAGKEFKDYQDFVNQTGIDLQKDVYSVVAAMYGSMDSEQRGSGRHRQYEIRPGQAAVPCSSKSRWSCAEEKYRGLDMYTLKNEDAKKDMRLAFLNKSNILFGSPLQLKKAIDLNLDKGKSVLQTAA